MVEVKTRYGRFCVPSPNAFNTSSLTGNFGLRFFLRLLLTSSCAGPTANRRGTDRRQYVYRLGRMRFQSTASRPAATMTSMPSSETESGNSPKTMKASSVDQTSCV